MLATPRMMPPIGEAPRWHAHVDALLARRTAATGQFFAHEAARIARLCHRVAERFARGGQLIALAGSPTARSDARHVAVEFVHPVIVGKRALPALGLTAESGALASQLRLLAGPDDVVLALGDPADGAERREEIRRAVGAANELGCLTVAFQAVGAEWEFVPPGDDPFVRQELVEMLYHIVWELVHVFFEHPGLLQGRSTRLVHDAGSAGFLYPFLSQREGGIAEVLRDVERSVRAKAAEVEELRTQLAGNGAQYLIAAAAALCAVYRAGGRLLVFGNGGSATDATDLAADFRDPPNGWRALPALDLTEDSAVLTAIANDIGVEALFARQVIAHGRPGDAVLALSTSGSSANILTGLEEARRRGMLTVALAGYDGGRIVAEGRADHAVVIRSEHLPRIQEAQATAYHILRELVEVVRGPD